MIFTVRTQSNIIKYKLGDCCYSEWVGERLKLDRGEVLSGSAVNSSCQPSGAWPLGAPSFVLDLKGTTQTFGHRCVYTQICLPGAIFESSLGSQGVL